MAIKYNEVFVQNTGQSDLVQINPQYVYLTIPVEYICVYHKLLSALSEFGKEIIDDCTAACKGDGKNIMNCWNLFQSAIACHELGKTKEAEFFINYIKSQLSNIYKNNDKKEFITAFPATIDKNGMLKSIVTCGTDVKFEVDPQTGELYEKYLNDEAEKASNNKVYSIDESGNMGVSLK